MIGKSIEKMQKNEKVMIIRIADEGFNAKPYDKGTTAIFVEAVVKDLEQEKIIEEKEAFMYENEKMEGCFCFLEGYDKDEFEFTLPFRKNQKINIGYLPQNELVFVRNTLNNQYSDKFVTGYYTDEIDEYTGERVKRKLDHRPYEFIKMPIYLAVERLKKHTDFKGGCADEEIAEIYLTKYQIEKILEKKDNQ